MKKKLFRERNSIEDLEVGDTIFIEIPTLEIEITTEEPKKEVKRRGRRKSVKSDK